MKAFTGKLDFCSNFYPSPISVYDNILREFVTYPDVERMYQAAKFIDPGIRREILNSKSPGAAKRLANGKYKKFIRKEWTPEYKRNLMNRLIQLKFNQHSSLRERLKEIEGDIVEYNNWHDNFFGHCVCDKCKDEIKHNHLGKSLMKIRG